jgi:hypothetical protein
VRRHWQQQAVPLCAGADGGFWPKTEGLMQVMRHLGLFEHDNAHRMPNLAIQVNLVGPEPKPVDVRRVP